MNRPDNRFDPNATTFPGQACVGGNRVGPDRNNGSLAGLRDNGTMVRSHSFNGYNVAGNLRQNTGPNAAGVARATPSQTAT